MCLFLEVGVMDQGKDCATLVLFLLPFFFLKFLVCLLLSNGVGLGGNLG